MIQRKELLQEVSRSLRRNPVVMLLGPRQIGKSTLAGQLLKPGSSNYFDLETPDGAAKLAEPYTGLKDLKGLVVIDEAQRNPAIFPILRVLADRRPIRTRFLLLGSASPELSRQANESLAGRTGIIDLPGLTPGEVGPHRTDRLWLRGGYPRSFLAGSDPASMEWRETMIRTYLERDLRVMGFGYSPVVMRRFWTLLAHYHGQIWNAAEAASAMGVSARTVNTYLDALEQTFMVRRVLPWYENVGKRLVKSPKIYFRDPGLFHTLLRIGTLPELRFHPKVGASWEGFVMEQVVSALKLRDFYFYNVHSGSELDMLFLYKGKRVGVEIKREDAPRMTKSMHVSMADLKLDLLRVIYPGEHRYTIGPNAECVPFAQLEELM